MKILSLSDIHFEYGGLELEQGDTDVIVLAGDLWKGARRHTSRESAPPTPLDCKINGGG
jgi:predicted phosphodiesterase